MTEFVADFEAYMPTEFNGQPYGVTGVLTTADEAGIDTCVVFPGGVPHDPREANAPSLTGQQRGSTDLARLFDQSNHGPQCN